MKFGRRTLASLLAAAMGCLGAARCGAEALPVPNPGFEDGTAGWTLYPAGDSKDKNCRFSAVGDAPRSGAGAARLESDDFARYCIGTAPVAVRPGGRYRVSVWAKAGPKWATRSGAPGFIVRLTLRQGGADAPGGHLYIGPGGRVFRDAPPGVDVPLTAAWTKVEAVVDIPAGIDSVLPGIFAWYAKGALFVDDFAIEPVEESVPATPFWQKPGAENAVAPALSSVPADASVPATGPVTSDADLLAALDLDAPGFGKVKAAAQSKDGGPDWDALQAAYLDYRRAGSPARWVVMPSDRPKQPSAKSDARGDEVIAHHIRNGYHFQPSEADMGADFNWTFNPVPRSDPAYTDEWTFCAVSRTEFWEALASAYWQTGDEKYAAAWVAQLRDFARKNPLRFAPQPGVPSLWRTLDAAERISISWPDCYFHFLESPSLVPDANWLYLKLNYEHAQLLLRGLADPSRFGNWVATECGALYTIGALFPEFRDAPAWRRTALERIGRELDRIVPPDGFEAELTPTYHFVALNGFIQPLKVAKLNGLEVPATFRDRILGMYRAPVLAMDQSGHAVPTNDSSAVDIAAKAREGLELGDDPLLRWAATRGREGQAPPDSTALPYAGFYAMRGGWKPNDFFLFFRAGPTGIAHEHEDMLEVVLRAWNKTLLFDPGTYTYDQSEWRRHAINTPSHNTIIVDGKWQHRGTNKPPVTDPTGNPWVATPLFDYAAGTYDGGYQENAYRPRPFYPELWKGAPDKSVSHTRRVLFLKPGYALVLDTLDGTGTHTFDAHFHLDAPAARLDPGTLAAFSQNGSGAQLALYPLEPENLAADIVKGQQAPLPLLGWMAGEHRATPTVRYRKQQAAPAVFATFLYPYQGEAPAFEALPLPLAPGEGFWSRRLKTPSEEAEIVVAKDGKPGAFAFVSGPAGSCGAEAAGLVVRKPSGDGGPFVGAWGLRSYAGAVASFTSASPASLVFLAKDGGVLFFNAGEAPATVTLTAPFAREAVLPPGVWTAVSQEAVSPAPAPVLFAPLGKADGSVSYDDYLNASKAFPAGSAGGAPIRVTAEAMTVPEKAVLAAKAGNAGKVVAKWEEPGTSAVAKLAVPQAGWYRVRIRYCSGAEPVRSLLVNGKVPFADAEGISLPSTIGHPPSDGWSNFVGDWAETVLGAGQVPVGWKVYFPQGPAEVALRTEAGGLNLAWLELVPARD